MRVAPLPFLGVSSKEHPYRRLTLTLQWRQAHCTFNHVLHHYQDWDFTVVFLQNVTVVLFWCQTQPHTKEQQNCYSKSHQNAKYYTIHSGIFLAKTYLSDNKSIYALVLFSFFSLFFSFSFCCLHFFFLTFYYPILSYTAVIHVITLIINYVTLIINYVIIIRSIFNYWQSGPPTTVDLSIAIHRPVQLQNEHLLWTKNDDDDKLVSVI